MGAEGFRTTPSPPSPSPGGVQSLSHAQLCGPVDCGLPGSLSSTVSWSLLKLISIQSAMPSSHLILCQPLLLLLSILSSITVFFSELALCIRWPKNWSFSFSISPSNEHPGLISFRMDWLDLLAVQGTLKGLLQHHGSKPSILQLSAFFLVQLLHLYVTPGEGLLKPSYPPTLEMATHSSTLAWQIPWTEEPGGLQSTGLQRVGHD